MDCRSCKEQAEATIPRSVFESVLARADRNARRLWIVIIILIILFVATNGYWIWYNSQWEVVETYQEVTQEADNGINRFIGGDYYGNGEDAEEDELTIVEAGDADESITDDNDGH